MRAHCRSDVAVALVLTLLTAPWSWAQDATDIRSQAVVRLTFDEADGDASDTASVGMATDVGLLKNEPKRVPSPFWNASGSRALQLDMARQQYVELADSVDLDRPDGVSISLLTVNLLEQNDGAYHGLFAKRGQQEGKVLTNYGINFSMQADTFQVYVNDGRGYRVVQYGVKDALPARKLLHVTATFQLADAPGQDADTDVDDIRVQYFVNGNALTPKAVNQGFVAGTEGWILDIDPAGLVNNLPVSIGRSEEGGEYYHGLVDEFLILPRALTAEEAKRLFLEVGGPQVEQLIQQDNAPPPQTPELARLSQVGVTVGQTTQLNVLGKNLLPDPRVVLPIEGSTVEIVGQPQADRLTVKVNIPESTIPGIYPLWVQTAHGISAAEAISCDSLRHVLASTVTAEKPLQLPAAVFGTLAGGQEHRVYFPGQKGQRFVADVELRRLGGTARPVLELKTASGTPLAIRWGNVAFHQDARLETTLPADGMYYLELHDLAYRAPGPNPYRIKLGDLTLIDGVLPLAGAPSEIETLPLGNTSSLPMMKSRLLGSGLDRWLRVQFPDRALPGPWPLALRSDGIEQTEAPQAPGAWQVVDATLLSQKTVAISGRIADAREHDGYVLQVSPGEEIRLTLQSASLSSLLQGELEVLGHPQGNRLAISSDQPSETDPTLEVAIPAGQSQIRVMIRDLFHRGGPQHVYRLLVEPTGRPSFTIVAESASVDLPVDGTSLTVFNVTRQGYTGPITLQVPDDAGLRISPSEIPAEVAGKVLCRLERTALPPTPGLPLVHISATSRDVEPAVIRSVVHEKWSYLPNYASTFAIPATPAEGLAIAVNTSTLTIYRGATTVIPVAITRNPKLASADKPIRFSTQTTETVRPRQANNPGAGVFPVVEAAPSQLVAADASTAEVKITVPLDTPENGFDLALVAESVMHPYSNNVLAKAVSAPIRLTVQKAVSPKVNDPTLAVVAESDHVISGVLQRTAGFTGSVEVALVGLPNNYTQSSAPLAGDAETFEIHVKAPAVAAETPVPNIKLKVTSGGSPVIAEMPLTIKVLPKPAAPAAATNATN